MKILATNRNANYRYHIEERYEAGISLLGSEVKACREGRVSINDGYVAFEKENAILEGVHISVYSKTGGWKPDPVRPRQLLLHSTEIKRLMGRVTQRGYTAVPTKMYLNPRGLIKIEIALAKGKKHEDRRETIKRRIHDREAQAAIKRHRKR